MASNPIEMASNLRAMASNLEADEIRMKTDALKMLPKTLAMDNLFFLIATMIVPHVQHAICPANWRLDAWFQNVSKAC